jgi:hypothetical protein
VNARVKQRHEKKQMHLWALVLGILLIPCTRGLAADTITVVNDAFFTNGSKAVISDIRVVIDGAPDQQKHLYRHGQTPHPSETRGSP